MARIQLFICLLFLSNLCSAQVKHDYIWRLGNKAGFNFSTGSLDTFTVGNENIRFFMSNASMCDRHGNVLFSSNGMTVVNTVNDTMVNGDTLSPGPNWAAYAPTGWPIQQGSISIPHPSDTNLYYLFHVGVDVLIYGPNALLPDKLSYSIIDKRLDNGNGAVTQKNLSLVNDTLTLGNLLAVKHGNGRDWWLITKRAFSNKFYRILITPSGINGPFVQSFGTPDPFSANFSFQSKFSPDGSRLVRYFDFEELFIYNFDRCTGLLSNEISGLVTDSNNLSAGLGIEFSPNERYLYVNTTLNLFQLDMQAANIFASTTHIATYDSFVVSLPTDFSQQQLAPDGKIYMCSTGGGEAVHIIHNPNGSGTNCNFVQHDLIFGNNVFGIGSFPNHPNYNLGPLLGSPCDSLTSITEVPTFKNTLATYPNPFNSEITVSIPNFKKNAELIVYNVLGEKLQEFSVYEQENQLLLNTYQAGIYFIEAISNDYSYKAKVVKQE